MGMVQKRRCAWAKRVQVRCSEEKCAYTRCTQANSRTCRCARLHLEINTIAVSRLAPAGRIAEGGSWRTGRIRDIRPEHVVTVGVGQAFEAGTLILMRLNSEDDRLLYNTPQTVAAVFTPNASWTDVYWHSEGVLYIVYASSCTLTHTHTPSASFKRISGTSTLNYAEICDWCTGSSLKIA